MPTNQSIPFTYFGDLLGVSSFYKLGGTIARDKLNDFYNTTFRTLRSEVQNGNLKVFMWSDSLFITGGDASIAIGSIAQLHGDLIRKGLLLRGAMVQGSLNFESRLTIDNFEKNLPTDDTLARAAGLEKSQKGARFVIEQDLVHKLVEQHSPQRRDWLTHEGYAQTGMIDGNDWLRKITPTPDGASFEHHYSWPLGVEPQGFDHRIKELKKLETMYDAPAKEQYEQTRKLLERTKIRHAEHSAGAVNPIQPEVVQSHCP